MSVQNNTPTGAKPTAGLCPQVSGGFGHQLNTFEINPSRVATQMANLGLTPQMVALSAGVSAGYIRALRTQRKRISRPTLTVIASVLETTPDDLIVPDGWNDEDRIVQLYRQLDTEGRNAIRCILDAMAGVSK